MLVSWGDIARIYAVLGAMLLCAVLGLARLLLRLRVAEAVKLGETL